jgi:hypothetical protein
MRLEGSCHCGSVRFSVESHTPYPFMRCYCSICRKTQGGGGYAINIMGEAATLVVRGKRALWVYDPRWPQWVYPFASAIDTPLPKAPDEVEIMLN